MASPFGEEGGSHHPHSELHPPPTEQARRPGRPAPVRNRTGTPPDAGWPGWPGTTPGHYPAKERKTFPQNGPAGGPKRKSQTQTLPPAPTLNVWRGIPYPIRQSLGPVPTRKVAQMPRPARGAARPARAGTPDHPPARQALTAVEGRKRECPPTPRGRSHSFSRW